MRTLRLRLTDAGTWYLNDARLKDRAEAYRRAYAALGAGNTVECEGFTIRPRGQGFEIVNPQGGRMPYSDIGKAWGRWTEWITRATTPTPTVTPSPTPNGEPSGPGATPAMLAAFERAKGQIGQARTIAERARETWRGYRGGGGEGEEGAFDLGLDGAGPTAEELAIQREGIAAQRQATLASLAASLMGERVAARQAAQEAAIGVLANVLPSAVSGPEQAATISQQLSDLYGRNIQLGTQAVPLDLAALRPTDVGAEQGAAAAMARRILGMRKGGVIETTRGEDGVYSMSDGGRVGIGRSKAREMLHHGTAHGRPLSPAFRGLLGHIASGKRPTRLRRAQGGIDVQSLLALIGLLPQLQTGQASLDVVQMLASLFGFAPGGPLSALLGQGAGELKGQQTLAGRAQTLAEQQAKYEQGMGRAQMAANPRDLFTLLFKARGKPTPTPLTGLGTADVFGLKHGGAVRGAQRALIRCASGGQAVEGPALVLVGDGAGGVKRGSAEYMLAQPGSVVAPKPKGERATVANAAKAIAGQLSKTPRAMHSLVSRAQQGLMTLPEEVWLALLQVPGVREILAGQRVTGVEALQPTADIPASVQQAYRPPTMANYYQMQNMAPSQRGIFQGLISALGIPPEDYEAVSQRSTAMALGQPLSAGFRSTRRARGVF